MRSLNSSTALFVNEITKICSGFTPLLSTKYLTFAATVVVLPAPAPAKPKMADAVYGAHMNGEMLLMNEVDDPVFAGYILGQGVAIEPSEGVLYSPADGEISNLFDTGHAIGVMTDEECDILLHIGIDTVKLEGKYFEPLVKEGDKVKTSDILGTIDTINGQTQLHFELWKGSKPQDPEQWLK